MGESRIGRQNVAIDCGRVDRQAVDEGGWVDVFQVDGSPGVGWAEDFSYDVF